MTYKKVKRADDRVARWTGRIKRGPKAEMEGKEEIVKVSNKYGKGRNIYTD